MNTFETTYKINPIEDYLIANGYTLQPYKRIGNKPTYAKEQNIIDVCWSCGWIYVNGQIIRFRSIGYKKLFELIPK